MIEDDDDFLYGPSAKSEPAPDPTLVSQPKPVDNDALAANGLGIVSQLEKAAEAARAQVELQLQEQAQAEREQDASAQNAANGSEKEEQDDDEEEGVELGEESDDDDLEIIMEPTASRSLDLRGKNQPRPSTSSSAPPKQSAPPPSLTTEYTPIQRGGSTASLLSLSQSQSQLSQSQSHSQNSLSQSQSQQPPIYGQTSSSTLQSEQTQPDDGIDTSTLPPAQAPPSHPVIDPNETGVFDGRSIFEVDINAMADKPWRRPGSDISDWFNYGFDEISWEAYCYRRRDLGDLANVLKGNVLNFSGMQEDQLTVLPLKSDKWS
ncbi:hypothetical protein D9758_018422 [Tetrapyrgos nigripes]|uniref:Pre-mRNA polyadenylation factor Fip1 domain-containing protein n=1 Tax=Tetrapyrgos nigripes TaxID=182062 RepID=A0A8H5GNV9_9AGAR|nr:hypothetical protein D9758_018422 [Tetrapyrgos nigripes]